MPKTANGSNGNPSRTDVRYLFLGHKNTVSVRVCAWPRAEQTRYVTRIHENDFADISSGNTKRCLTMAAIRCYVGSSPTTASLKTLTSEEQVHHFSSLLAGRRGPFLIQQKLTPLWFLNRNDLNDKLGRANKNADVLPSNVVDINFIFFVIKFKMRFRGGSRL